jgi:hypothetical protein
MEAPNEQCRPRRASGSFRGAERPRQHAKVLYPLPEILLLVLSATLAGADDFVETVVWGKEHLGFPRRFFRVRPAWAHSCGCKSRRKLVMANEAKRNCMRVTECGEEAWSEAAGR